MPLWYRARQSEGRPEGPWMQREIGAAGLRLGEREDGQLAMGEAGTPPIATLRPHRVRGSAVAVLVIGRSSTPVLVDGYPPLSVSVLNDWSELVVGRHVLRYSAYPQPSVTLFSETEQEACCVTCTRPLAVGDEILRCGSCQAPRHEGKLAAPDTQPLLCASYAAQCCRCGARQDNWLNDEREPSTPGGAAKPPTPPTREGNCSA